MTLDAGLLQDPRGTGKNKEVARGHEKRPIILIIPNTLDTISVDFDAWGKLEALLVEIPNLAAGTETLTIDIFPKGSVNDEARMFTLAAIAESLDHYIVIAENTTNNLERHLFGKHTMKITSSAVVTADRTITVHPILI